MRRGIVITRDHVRAGSLDGLTERAFPGGQAERGASGAGLTEQDAVTGRALARSPGRACA